MITFILSLLATLVIVALCIVPVFLYKKYKDEVDKQISSMTFPTRKVLYKLKMFKRFWKHLFMSWECCEAVFYLPMEIFKDFYVNEFIDTTGYVDWSNHRKDKNARKQMDEIYIYYVHQRPAIKEIYELYLELACSTHTIDWRPCNEMGEDIKEGEDFELCRYETQLKPGFTQKQQDFYFAKTHQYEEELRIKDEKYLVMLSKLRWYLWT
jgi:hypothetical protein